MGTRLAAIERSDEKREAAKLTRELDVGGAFVQADGLTQRGLIATITPVIRARAARAVAGYRRRQSAELDVDEITQEVLALLFEKGARVLQRWDPQRGMSLLSYVGMVAERAARRLLRRHRHLLVERSTFDECAEFDIADPTPGPEARLALREFAALALTAIRGKLTPRGRELFEALLVEDRCVDEVSAQMGMSRDAAYAWRSRLAKVARRVSLEIGTD